MRFADYFGRAFASVGAAQFPWLKMFKESTVGKLVDVSNFQLTFFIFSGEKNEFDWGKRKKILGFSGLNFIVNYDLEL